MICLVLLDIHLSRSACEKNGRLVPFDSDRRCVAGDIQEITADRLASIKLAVRTLNSHSESWLRRAPASIGWGGTGNLSYAARASVQCYPEAVQLDYGRDEAQTQACSARISALVGSVEASHDRVPFVFSYPLPRVRDPNYVFVFATGQSKIDASARRREFDCIVDQIRHCL